MSDRPRPFARMLIACIFFFSAVTLNILLPRYWHNTPEIVKHLLLVFSAIMCVHIMEYAYLWWEIFGHIRNILKETLQATHQLIDDNRNSIEKSLQTANQLIGTASTCGLTNIYCSRKDVKGDIYDAIENAEKRVWLLGITLSENVNLDELLPTLNEKITGGLEVKLLSLTHFKIQQSSEHYSKALPMRLQRLSILIGQIPSLQTPSFVRDYTATLPMYVTDSEAIQMLGQWSDFMLIPPPAG